MRKSSLLALLLLFAPALHADPLELIDTSGMAPKPRVSEYDSRHEPLCEGDARSPQTLAEQALAGIGWLLTDPALIDEDTRVVAAADAQEGQCRFWGTTVFVLRKEMLIGMIRTEDPQAYLTLRLEGPEILVVDAKYRKPGDANCCPSGELTVRYGISDESVRVLEP